MPFDSLPVLPGFTETFPVVEEDEVGLTLRKARELIRHGWCQGELYRGDNYCAVGAIRMALGWNRTSSNPLYRKTLRRLANSLPPASYPTGKKITDLRLVIKWNDTPTREKYEVLEQFDLAIMVE